MDNPENKETKPKPFILRASNLRDFSLIPPLAVRLHFCSRAQPPCTFASGHVVRAPAANESRFLPRSC